jgi:hypothetical protein
LEGRSSVRTWLHRIATNVCLTSLNGRQRRLLPSGLGPPSLDPHATAAPPPTDVVWLEPIPDHFALDERSDPAEVAAARQTVRLALVAAAQILPPHQRAAFFLCDVLGRPGAEAAAVLRGAGHHPDPSHPDLALLRARDAQPLRTPFNRLTPGRACWTWWDDLVAGGHNRGVPVRHQW